MSLRWLRRWISCATKFLARAGFAEDEHRGVGRRDQINLADDLPKRRALADQIAEGFGLHDLFLQIGVLLFELRFQALDFLEGARVGDGPGDVIGKNASPHFRALRHVRAAEHGDEPKDFAFINNRHAVIAADFFRLEPGNIGEFARILVQIAQHDLLARRGNFSGGADADGNPCKAIRHAHIFFFFALAAEQIAAAGDGVQAAGLVGTIRTAHAGRANIAFFNQPDADAGDVGTIQNPAHQFF